MPTILHRLSRWAEESPSSIAQRFKKEGVWKELTAQDYRDRVYWLALYLRSEGLGAQEAAAILSINQPAWLHFDLAVLLLGAKSAGLYPNSTGPDIQYILDHTEARILGVQNAEFFKKIPDSSKLKRIIVFDGDASISPQAISYEAALEKGRALAGQAGAPTVRDFLEKLDPNAGAIMIYTSGTTGQPKGALLSHDNLTYTTDIVSRYWNLPMGQGTLFSFLPLCHIAEKLHSVGVGISRRYTVSYCTKFENVSIELPEVQPTLLLCVPRVWEKMMEGVMGKVQAGKGLKKHLASWALGVGARRAHKRFPQSGQAQPLSILPLDLLQNPLADRLVLSKVRAALGLGKAELLASGAAALPAHVCRWFRSIGLEILEDYGQTESTGVICMTERGKDCAGTVGRAVPGIEVKLAEDGEILTRGRHVFKGYFKDAESTAKTLKDGWLCTGDLGRWDERGYLCIQGRKKEVLKTSGGKMVAPLPIEERLKAYEEVSQVCVVGDGRKYLGALITLSEGFLARLHEQYPQLRNGSLGPTLTLPEVLEPIKKHIAELNQSLAGFEQIKRFAVLAREFSILEGEMTPTLKMKRNVIETRYREVIDQLYSP